MDGIPGRLSIDEDLLRSIKGIPRQDYLDVLSEADVVFTADEEIDDDESDEDDGATLNIMHEATGGRKLVPERSQ
jgi:hypothetical protein